jgi:hypothetical protein
MPETSPLAYAAPKDPVGPDDHYYLRVLAYCHWAFAAMIAFGGLMVCFAVPQADARVCGAAMIVGGALSAVAGLLLFTKRSSWFILSICALTLLVFPFGTILGVCTIGVLRRPGVFALFHRGAGAE